MSRSPTNLRVTKVLVGEALNTACHILNRVPLKHNTSTPFELWKGIPSNVSLDDSLASTSIPKHVKKMSNVGVNPSSTSLTHAESGEPRQKAKQWKETVKSEMDSIVSNGTWVLVDLPPGYTTTGCKWIFKKKLKPDGSFDKFKARLVAKDFKQKKEIDYFDTYSPVARLTTIRVLIALVSITSRFTKWI
ncbi:Retrovirus-related Pol polyprotein from transposon RE1 [Sesamum angolense]|uniref:Retrovirus-related Pol polyprotein from transposon RE1 n=1 Tax=Sesamum angolense TaxID=2727404 RepID=A0AAE1WQE2_9LAMI|nr:Retrovirus-related Pol polyprotein from transposon RE1 [Sesamum angolense]